MQSRIMELVQYEFNPKTGEDLHFNEDTILTAISTHTSIKRWAYIRHDQDVYDIDDEKRDSRHKVGTP